MTDDHQWASPGHRSFVPRPTWLLHPHTIDICVTVGTLSIPHVSLRHLEAPPPDDNATAVWTVGVLQTSTGQVAHVDIPQPSFPSQFVGTAQRPLRGRSTVIHLVCRMKATDVPWRLYAQLGGNELGNLTQLRL